jgi:hypothetical protein
LTKGGSQSFAAACEWTQMDVLSIMNCQSSVGPSSTRISSSTFETLYSALRRKQTYAEFLCRNAGACFAKDSWPAVHAGRH